jgi:hypothetical protein
MAERTRTEAALSERVAEILEAARAGAARSVNVAMVRAYWLIGREIVQVEQGGARRAGYGDQLIARLSERLRGRYGKTLSPSSLKRMRRFYAMYSAPRSEIGSAVLTQSLEGRAFATDLGWSHYLLLMNVKNSQARSFYEIEAAREGWSTRELERQIASLLFDRLAKSRTPEQVMALARKGQEIATPQDVLKEPLVLEFLDLGERPGWHERELESALIDRLSEFLHPEFGAAGLRAGQTHAEAHQPRRRPLLRGPGLLPSASAVLRIPVSRARSGRPPRRPNSSPTRIWAR